MYLHLNVKGDLGGGGECVWETNNMIIEFVLS